MDQVRRRKMAARPKEYNCNQNELTDTSNERVN